MTKAEILVAIALVLCLIVFLLTVLDFLALHDIHNDYVSARVIEVLDTALSQDLPAWAATPAEWGIVRVSYYSRFLFFLFNIAVLSICLKGLKAGNSRNQRQSTETGRIGPAEVL